MTGAQNKHNTQSTEIEILFMVSLAPFAPDDHLARKNSCSKEKSRQSIARGVSLEGRGHKNLKLR
jgi:hypothetical protein